VSKRFGRTSRRDLGGAWHPFRHQLERRAAVRSRATRPIDGRAVVIREGCSLTPTRYREVTLLGCRGLERAGTFDNLRIAAGLTSGERRGMVFSDSDVYKWLEALAWEMGRGRPRARALARERSTSSLPHKSLTATEQLVPGRRSGLALDRSEDGPRALLRGHLIQAGVAFARAVGDTSSSRSAVASPTDRRSFGSDARWHRRPSGDRSRARRALPADGSESLLNLAETLTAVEGPECSRAALSISATTGRRACARHALDRRHAVRALYLAPASPTSTPRPATRRF